MIDIKKIAVIEDDRYMREELVSILTREDYETECITSYDNIIEVIINSKPDAILLDINLPVMSGFDICRALRKSSSIPILILTSRDMLRDEVHALNLGADDYLTKPCHSQRLLARMSRLLRREREDGNFARVDSLRLDLNTYTIYIDSSSAILPENQGRMMELLILNYGEIVTKEMFFNKIWGTTDYIDENALQVNMTRLKKTLRNIAIPYRIETIRGKGYRLIKEDNNDAKD